jgi:predicted O-methyltransferase YrrM
MADSLAWLSEERCAVGDVVFQTLPTAWLRGSEASMDGADFFLMKDRASADRFAALVADVRPRNIFELGIYAGGSTALLCELATPRCLVAIDNQPVNPALRDYLRRRGLDAVVHLHGDVDQANGPRLSELADTAFGGEPLDLVVDDCSHLYGPTRASFNALFPRLRPGGVYLIEDWPWAHTVVGVEGDGFWPDEVPLTRVIFEIVLAVPSVPGLISDVSVDGGCVRIRRGDAPVDSRGFDIVACCKPRGRRLLA